MTRSKETARIERALTDKDERELLWARSYSVARQQIAPNARAKRHWAEIEARVEAAISSNRG